MKTIEARRWILDNCFTGCGNKINPNCCRISYWNKTTQRQMIYKIFSENRTQYKISLRILLFLNLNNSYNCLTCGNELKTNRWFCGPKCQMNHFTAIPFKNAWNEKARNKRVETCLFKYGVDNVFKNDDIKKKIELIMETRFGVRNIFMLQEYKEAKIYEKYGVDNIAKSVFIKEKIRKKKNEKFIKMIESSGFCTEEEYKRCFSYYRRLVGYHTRNQDLKILENFDKPRTLCGVVGGYQLDHIIPIKVGFEMGILPSIIGNINNLRFIPWKENRSKGYKTPNVLPISMKTFKEN